MSTSPQTLNDVQIRIDGSPNAFYQTDSFEQQIKIIRHIKLIVLQNIFHFINNDMRIDIFQ